MVWVNRLLLVVFVCLSCWVFISRIKRDKVSENELLTVKYPQPRAQGVTFSKEAYENFGEGFLGSKNRRIQKELENSLQFLGANTRPDAHALSYFFSFKGKALVFTGGKPHPLTEILGDELTEAQDFYFTLSILEKPHVKISVFEKKGENHCFTSKLKDQTPPMEIHIGGSKLDNYFLTRQKINWVGTDLFLKCYGGEDYEIAQDHTRIDFMHQNPPYSRFVQERDYLVWKDGQWQDQCPDSNQYPLMEINRIEPQSLMVTIFDVTGRHQHEIALTLSRAHPISSKLSSLKYIGAKSPKKWLFKDAKTRLCIEPGDWLLNVGHKWEKINSIEAMDRYIQKINLGELFVVKEFKDDQGKKVLVGDLFNSSRTQQMDYTMQVSGPVLKK